MSHQGLNDLKLRFVGSLIEQIGAQMYPSATASVAELISNAWDADAPNVWVSIPYGEAWQPGSEIVVVDDGHGMTHDEAKRAYLIVGRKRREVEQRDSSAGGRKLHGRKGMGKLAAFGTAEILEVYTVRNGETTAFRLNYDAIRALDPDQDYQVEPAKDLSTLTRPDTGERLGHGTRIRLTQLRLKAPIAEERFLQSMARRFAVDSADMRVAINSRTLERFDIPLRFRMPPSSSVTNGTEAPAGAVVEGDWYVDLVDPADPATEIRWWMGFTPKPLDDETQPGVAVFADGKMLQRPFLFERSRGTEGQLGEKYVVGEVRAPWLDRGFGIEDDLALANRDQLQLEDARLQPLLAWGQRRLAWALAERNDLIKAEVANVLQVDPEMERLLFPYTKRERTAFGRIQAIVEKLPEITNSSAKELMVQVVNGAQDTAVRELMDRIDDEDDLFQVKFWDLVREFGLIDARRNLSLIDARLHTIEKLRAEVQRGATEVPILHGIVKENPWLLDPRWYLVDDEVDQSTIPELRRLREQDETDPDLRLDFLFVLGPPTTGPRR